MVKIITISIPDYVYNTYLLNYAGNRSKLIEGAMVKGFEVEEGEFEILKQKVIKLTSQLRTYEFEIGQLKKEVTRYKKMYKPDDDPELIAKKRAVDAIIKSGILADGD